MLDDARIAARLIADEGEVLHAYADHLGFLTIGVGRLIDERRGGGITQQESRYLLRNDIAKCVAQLEQRFEWWSAIDDVRQGVLICMTFQLGINGVANFKRMIAALKVRDYITASIEAMDSDWFKQTPERAKRMARVLRLGVWE